MRIRLFAAASVALAACIPAYATEPGGPAQVGKAGILIGASAGVPPPGIYMFNQVFTYQGSIAGPITNAIGSKTHVSVGVDVQGFLFAPGWTFLGATYDALLVQSFSMASVGGPINTQSAGMYNTLIIPVELSWRLADTGFVVKAGLGIWTPDGTISGSTGLGNGGIPYWTYQPEFILSYLKDGWNLSVAISEEFHAANARTGYQTGDVLHADFTATKSVGKWTLGPVAYYEGQVTNDRSSAYYGYALGTQRFNVWAVGGLIGYDFGPANLNVWATQEISAKASGATTVGGFDPSATSRGFTVLASLGYRLWAPDENSRPKRPMFFK